MSKVQLPTRYQIETIQMYERINGKIITIWNEPGSNHVNVQYANRLMINVSLGGNPRIISNDYGLLRAVQS